MARSTLNQYLDNIRHGNMGFFWEPVGAWIRAHGDGKATTEGQLFTETMTTSADPLVYRVRVMRGGVSNARI